MLFSKINLNGSENHFQKTEVEIAEYLSLVIPSEETKKCVTDLFQANIPSILLVTHDKLFNTIWMYKKDGIALVIGSMGDGLDGNGAFECHFFNFTGDKCTFNWPGKEEGALPF